MISVNHFNHLSIIHIFEKNCVRETFSRNRINSWYGQSISIESIVMIISHWSFTYISLSLPNDELKNNMTIRQITEFYWSTLGTGITIRKESELILARNCSRLYCEDNIVDILSNLGGKLRNWAIVFYISDGIRVWLTIWQFLFSIQRVWWWRWHLVRWIYWSYLYRMFQTVWTHFVFYLSHHR
jgi:hypothetical protein